LIYDSPWQGHRENAPLPHLAFDGERTVLGLDQCLGDRQSQAQARFSTGAVYAVKTFKNV